MMSAQCIVKDVFFKSAFLKVFSSKVKGPEAADNMPSLVGLKYIFEKWLSSKCIFNSVFSKNVFFQSVFVKK